MRTKVVGVTFSNEDGSSRARIIAGMSERDQICLDRDPYNPYDANAVKVSVIKNGEKKQIGFLSKDIASDISAKLRRGVSFSVYIAGVGTWNDRPFCELDITESTTTSSAAVSSASQRTVTPPVGPTFTPSRPAANPAPSPTFTPSRPAANPAPSPTFTPSKPSTSKITPSSPTTATRTATPVTPKKVVATPTPSTKNTGSNTSSNSGCFSIVVFFIVVITAFLMF